MPKTKKRAGRPAQKTKKNRRTATRNPEKAQKLMMNAKSFISFDAFEEFVQDVVTKEQVKLLNASKVKVSDAMANSLAKISVRKIWNDMVDEQIQSSSSSAKKLIIEKNNHVLHMNWCGICGKKDNLFKCKFCCISYHEKCSKKHIESTFGSQINANFLMDACAICLVKGKIRSGSIVWHKMKTFPWWPAIILASPEKTGLKKPPTPYYLPVFYYGSQNYGWAHEKQMCWFDINYDVIKNKNEAFFQKALTDALTDFDKHQRNN